MNGDPVLDVYKMMLLSKGPSISPASGFNYCARIMSQIQSGFSLALNLYGASIMKPSTSADHTSCPRVTPAPVRCECLFNIITFIQISS